MSCPSGDAESWPSRGSGVHEQLNDPKLTQKGGAAGASITDDTTASKLFTKVNFLM
jgi:hypothetical protein